MKKLSAKEMRKLAEKRNSSAENHLHQINKAASNGRFSLKVLSNCITTLEKQTLKKLGYKIEVNGKETTINW